MYQITAPLLKPGHYHVPGNSPTSYTRALPCSVSCTSWQLHFPHRTHPTVYQVTALLLTPGHYHVPCIRVQVHFLHQSTSMYQVTATLSNQDITKCPVTIPLLTLGPTIYQVTAPHPTPGSCLIPSDSSTSYTTTLPFIRLQLYLLHQDNTMYQLRATLPIPGHYQVSGNTSFTRTYHLSGNSSTSYTRILQYNRWQLHFVHHDTTIYQVAALLATTGQYHVSGYSCTSCTRELCSEPLFLFLSHAPNTSLIPTPGQYQRRSSTMHQVRVQAPALL
jgi:hypothetical protein